jgi:hypothetical protein
MVARIVDIVARSIYVHPFRLWRSDSRPSLYRHSRPVRVRTDKMVTVFSASSALVASFMALVSCLAVFLSVSGSDQQRLNQRGAQIDSGTEKGG